MEKNKKTKKSSNSSTKAKYAQGIRVPRKPPAVHSKEGDEKDYRTIHKKNEAKTIMGSQSREMISMSAPESLAAIPPKHFYFRPFQRHGETRVVAFVRDPYCVFVYWEVASESLETMKKQLGGEYWDSNMVLRVLRMVPGGIDELVEEIKVESGQMNSYLEFKEPSGSYFIEIGLKTASGRFVAYARSKTVPLSTITTRTDILAANPRWNPPLGITEYYSKLGLENLVPGGISSAENQKRKRGRYWASRF